MAIAHFAVGVMATALLFALVAPRLLHSPTVLALGGVWGMLPDAHWVLPVGSEFVYSIHMSSWANAFWLHHYLDGIDPADSPRIAAGLVILLVVVLAFCELLTRTGTAPTAASPVESGHE